MYMHDPKMQNPVNKGLFTQPWPMSIVAKRLHGSGCYLVGGRPWQFLHSTFFIGLGPKFLDSRSQPSLSASPRNLHVSLVWVKPIKIYFRKIVYPIPENLAGETSNSSLDPTGGLPSTRPSDFVSATALHHKYHHGHMFCPSR